MNRLKNQKCRRRPDSQLAAYAATPELRITEFKEARTFFQAHPTQAYSRADLCDILNLPINHITRIVYDLPDADIIRVAGKRINPRSGIRVEVLQLRPENGQNNDAVEVNREEVGHE